MRVFENQKEFEDAKNGLTQWFVSQELSLIQILQLSGLVTGALLNYHHPDKRERQKAVKLFVEALRKQTGTL
jgi:hypothetical protein